MPSNATELLNTKYFDYCNMRADMGIGFSGTWPKKILVTRAVYQAYEQETPALTRLTVPDPIPTHIEPSLMFRGARVITATDAQLPEGITQETWWVKPTRCPRI